MSADNGVYILGTPKGKGVEFRVQHLQAVEGIYNKHCPSHGLRYDMDCEICNSTEEGDIDDHIKNARLMWTGKVYTKGSDAQDEAWKIMESIAICEYGICFISIDREF